MDAEIDEYNLGAYSIRGESKKNVSWTKKENKNYKNFSEIPNEKYSIYTYKFKELVPYKNESGQPGPTYFIPHLLYKNKSYNKGSYSGTVFKTSADLYEWYHTLVDELNTEPSETITKLTDSITQGIENDLDKIRKVFYWVQDNIRYIAFEDGIAGFKPDEAENVCSYRYGDCKGMANLTKTMLLYLGFDARLTWIGTRRIAYNYNTPSLAVDNHMICTVFLNNEKYFLDATENYISLGDYAHRIQGRQVLIENGETFILDTIPEFTAMHNLEKTIYECKIIDGQLFVQTNKTMQGESKTSILQAFSGIQKHNKEKALRAFITHDDKNFTVTKLSYSHFEERERDISLKYEFSLKNNIIVFENKILINPFWEKEFYYLLIENDRQSQYEFGKKYCIETQNTIQIPQGYSLAELPTDLKIEKEGYTFILEFKEVEGKIICLKKLVIENTLLEKKEFNQWNSNIEKLRKGYDLNVVFVKN